MAILGAMGAAVMLAIPDPRGSLREEGERFAARLIAGRDAAIVGGRDVAVRVGAGGYAFETRRLDGWAPLDGRAFRNQGWADGTAARVEPADAGRILFDPTGLATPAVVGLTRDGAALRVKVDASGAVRIDAG